MPAEQVCGLAELQVEKRPVAELAAGAVSTVVFGGLAVVEGVLAAVNRDPGILRPTAILAAMAYGGYRLARNGYDRLCSPEAYNPPAAVNAEEVGNL